MLALPINYSEQFPDSISTCIAKRVLLYDTADFVCFVVANSYSYVKFILLFLFTFLYFYFLKDNNMISIGPVDLKYRFVIIILENSGKR